MRNRIQLGRGYTLLEMTISMALLLITLSAAMTGWLYVVRGERENSIQAELDIDVRTAMEWIKYDLRLSSMDHVMFYPAGPGPYSAMSFPMAQDDDDDGLVELDGDGHIIWDKTVVFHVWDATPNQLRLTTFDPRDTSLSIEERQDQLDSVVANGNGDYTHNAANAASMPLFENLFEWEIHGKGAIFDCYYPEIRRARGSNLGSIILSCGWHDFKFSCIGKNPDSGGYSFGLDSIAVSPCGVEREAEAQLPVAAEAGANAIAEFMGNEGSWSGNYQLTFPGTEAGHYFTLSFDNDRWEETNFRATAALCENTGVKFDESLDPKDFIVSLDGGPGTTNWDVHAQTRDNANHGGPGEELRGYAVRVLIRGGEMLEGGYLLYNGGTCKIRFDAGLHELWIDAAYIAECSDTMNPTPDALTGGTQLFFDGCPSVHMSSGWAARYATPAAGTKYRINKDKSYLVSFLVNGAAGKGSPEYWVETRTNVPGCYVIMATNAPTAAMVQQAAWSNNLPYVTSNRVYVVKYLESTHATNGTFVSQVIDTQVDSPTYTDFSWNSDEPSGTTLGLKIRAGNSDDLSGSAWQPGVGGLVGGYVQFMGELESNDSADFDSSGTPKLKDVTIKWDGVTQLSDIGGGVMIGPNCGIYALTVDGQELTKGVTVDLEIYQDISGFGGETKRLTSAMTTEIEPQNTGK